MDNLSSLPTWAQEALARAEAATEGPWEEAWHSVPSLLTYEVSDQGRVRSYLKKGNHKRKHADYPRLLKLRSDSRGYVSVSLPDSTGHYKNRTVHRLVLEAFIGPCPAGHEVAHLNGDPSDNRLSNLMYCTHKENEAHKRKHGTLLLGERNPASKLLGWQVAEMKYLASRGIPQYKIASLLDLHTAVVNDVLREKIWSHVPARADIPRLCAAFTGAEQELDTMQAERDRWCMDWETASAELLNERSRVMKAEAALAKAIEALKWYVEGGKASSWLAAAVLAEIAGKHSERQQPELREIDGAIPTRGKWESGKVTE